MSRSGEITLPFGLKDRTFKLGIKQWERLDEELAVGPGVLLARCAGNSDDAMIVLASFPALIDEVGRFRHRDLIHILTQGLLGASVEPVEVPKIVRAVEVDGGIMALVKPAFEVVKAALMGVEVEQPAGEPSGVATGRPHSQTDGSGSAETASTPSAPPPASRRSRSTK